MTTDIAEEYPDMALITFDELRDFMERGAGDLMAEMHSALINAQTILEQIGIVASGCASTHGDPGGGLEMIDGYTIDAHSSVSAAIARAEGGA